MCLSTSTLIYGRSVKSTSLCAAALAWSRSLRSSLIVLDILISRRCQGTLKASSTRIADVPVEVWAQIKQEVSAVELEDAEESIVWEYRFGHMSLEDWEDERSFYGFDYLGDCDFCWREFTEGAGTVKLLQNKQKVRFRRSFPSPSSSIDSIFRF
jgi:hypothetical protein